MTGALRWSDSYEVGKGKTIASFYQSRYRSIRKLDEAASAEAGTDIYVEELEELTRPVSLSPGEFGAHIGYVPQLKSGKHFDPEESQRDNTEYEGSGELGRIMGSFMYMKSLEGYGYAQTNTPCYDRKLWNDEGSWMKAPTMRAALDTVELIRE